MSILTESQEAKHAKLASDGIELCAALPSRVSLVRECSDRMSIAVCAVCPAMITVHSRNGRPRYSHLAPVR